MSITINIPNAMIYSFMGHEIFHHTHLPMQKWFLAVTLVLNAKKGLSSRQLARDLKVNKDTAWRMGMKIREAMWEQGQREQITNSETMPLPN